MKYRHILYFLFFISFTGFAQSNESIPVELKWEGIKNFGNDPFEAEVIAFQDARYPDESGLPNFYHEIAIDSNCNYSIEVKKSIFIPVSADEKKFIDSSLLSNEPSIKTFSSTFRHEKSLNVYVLPFILRNDSILKLSSFELAITTNANVETRKKASTSASTIHSYASNSVLASGSFFKVRITESGLYRLSYEDLRAKGIDPGNVRVFGYGGAILEESFLKDKPDDLPEIPVYDNGSSIIFYAQGINKWTYNEELSMFTHKQNPYSKYGYYFVTSSNVGEKKRIKEKNAVSGEGINEVNTFTAYRLHEKDSTNQINSGREFYGEAFKNGSSRNFSFNFPNISTATTDSIKLRVEAVSTATATYSVKIGSQSESFTLSKTNNIYEWAALNTATLAFNPTGSSFAVNIKLSTSSSGTGYLNFIEVNARRQLIMNGASMVFHNTNNIGSSSYNRYHLTTNNSNIQVWDITDPIKVQRVKTASESSKLTFIDTADQVKSYLAFNPSSDDIPKAELLNEIASQNIHGMGQADMLIITHPLFTAQANALAEAHYKNSGLIVKVATTEQVYNEFSSGTPDASAYRWGAKMFYDRPEIQDDRLKYLLLFGKGTFDNRKILPASGQNLVLTFQSNNSIHETKSYVTDDYFGLMDDEEGISLALTDKTDIGIGRFPVKTEQEAWNVVNKTIAYMENKEMGNWKNQLCFLADDGGPNDSDKTIHMRDINIIADSIVRLFPSYQTIKILLDAYQQETNASGERYPAVNTRLQNLFRTGIFSLSYMGHGGTSGLTNEQVLMTTDIKALTNKHLPIVSAGTCNFSTFDNETSSGGEEFLLNPIGGSIGTFSAARTVYTGFNKRIVEAFNKNLFRKTDGEYARIGDIIMKSKKEAGNDVLNPVNNLSYVYFGDPAIRLNYPSPYEVIATEINGKDVAVQDSLKALSVATVKGVIKDVTGNRVDDFNGYVRVTVYDKEQEIKTLVNDAGSKEITFKDRPNTIYTGKTKATNGKFEFTFMLPKDIRYNYGTGRMNFYACDETNNNEGQGYYEDFYVGGSNKDYEEESDGPEVSLYLNHKDFVPGSKVNETPLFVAEVYDKNGINTSGAGTGHDIILFLDNNTEDSWYNLNEYYETNEGSYQSGKVKFVFPAISEGEHTLTFKVWDLLNNSTTETLDFIVVNGLKPVVFSVANYPNPATEYTNIQILHDREDELVEFTVDIFDLSGRKIWSFTEKSGNNEITWNLSKNSGDKITSGVYIYRVSVLTDGKVSSAQSNKIIVIGQ